MTVGGLRRVFITTPFASKGSWTTGCKNAPRQASRGGRTRLYSAALLVAAASCSGTQAAPSCTPGATQACLGPGQCAGAQICASSGSAWGPCDCGGPDAAVTGTTDAQATSADASNADAQATSADAGNADAHVPVPTLLIDNQSSPIGEISLANGGYWTTFGLTGTITPPPEDPFFFTAVDAGSFSSAACFSASGVTGLSAGAAFGFQLDAADGGITPYDASAYSGISFYAMSPDATELVVNFQDTDTDVLWPGARCAGGADAGPVPPGGYPAPPCGDGPSVVVPLTADWQQHSLAFAMFAGAPGGGFYAPVSPDEQGLILTGFQVDNPNADVDGGVPLSFHVCVAQIYFTQ